MKDEDYSIVEAYEQALIRDTMWEAIDRLNKLQARMGKRGITVTDEMSARSKALVEKFVKETGNKLPKGWR